MIKLLLLIFPFTLAAQIEYSKDDILKAATHTDQWLLTNTSGDQEDYAYGVSVKAQAYIYSKTKWKAKYSRCGSNCDQWIHQSDAIKGLKGRRISYKLYYDYLPNGKRVSKKVVFEGNKDLIIDFFMNYWTDDLEFTSNKGYVATARFLSDIATLQYNEQGDAFVMVTTSNKMHDKISFMD